MPPATPAFRLPSCPHPPPTPFPAGRGRPRLFHARGFAPCIPGTEPMVRRNNGRKRFPARVPPGLRSRGAGGGSPRRNKVKVSPFPAGEGGWGDRGQEGNLKAGVAGGKESKLPAGQRQRPPKPTRKKQAPLRAGTAGDSQCRVPSNPGDARGEAPCMRKLKISPFPAGEERSASAGWGDILPLRGRRAGNKAKGRGGGQPQPPLSLLTEKPTPQPAESPTPKNKEIQYVGK